MESKGSKRYYTDYCNHLWRFYVRTPTFKERMDTAREADKRGFASCMKVFETLNTTETGVICEFHEMDVNIPFIDRVGMVASMMHISRNDVCQILARVNAKLAEARGLI